MRVADLLMKHIIYIPHHMQAVWYEQHGAFKQHQQQTRPTFFLLISVRISIHIIY